MSSDSQSDDPPPSRETNLETESSDVELNADNTDKPDQSGEPGRPLWRKVLRVLRLTVQWTLITVVSLVAILLLLLHTDWGRSQAVGIALDFVNPMFEGEIRVGRLDGTIFGDLSVHDVEILAPDGTTALELETLDLEYEIWPLFSQEVVVTSIRVSGPEMTLQDLQGNTLIAQAFQPTEPAPPEEPTGPSPWVVDVREIIISDVYFEMSSAEDAIKIRNGHLSMVARVEAGDIHWSELAISTELEALPVYSADIGMNSGSLIDGALEVDQLTVSTDVVTLAASAHFEPGDDPGFTLTLNQLEVPSLETLRTALSSTVELPLVRGPVSLSGTVTGALSSADVALAADLGPAGELTVTGSAGLRDGTPWWDLTLLLDNLAPVAAMPSLPFAGAATLTIESTGNGNPMADGEASLDVLVSQLSIPDAPGGMVPLPLQLNGTIAGGQARVTLLAGAEPYPLELRGSATFLEKATEAQVNLQIRDLNPKPLLSWLGMEGISADIRNVGVEGQARLADGDIVASGTFSTTVADLSVDEEVGVKASAGMLDLSGNVAWSSGDTLPTGDINLSASDLDAAGNQVGGLEVNLGIAEVDGKRQVTGQVTANSVNAAGTSARRVEIPLDLTLGERLDAPEGTVEVSVADLKTGDLTVERAGVDLRLSASDEALRARGSLNARRVALPPDLDLPSLSATLDVRRSFDGPISGNVTLKGKNARVPGVEKLGRYSGDLSFRLDPSRPENIETSGTVRLSDIQQSEKMQSGAAEAKFDLELRSGRPVGTASVQLRDIVAGERTLDTATADVRVEKSGRLRARVQAASGSNSLSTQIVGNIFGSANQSLKLDELDIETPVGGLRASGVSRVQLKRDGSVEVNELRLKGTDDLEGQIAVDGTWNASAREMRGRVLVTNVHIARWLAVFEELTGLDLLEDTEVDGVVTLEAAIFTPRGKQRPEARISLDLSGGRYGDIVEELDVWAGLSVSDDGVLGDISANWGSDSELELELDVSRGFISLSPLAIEMEKDIPYEADGRIEGIQLSQFAPYLPLEPDERLEGELAAEIYADGTLSTPRVVLEMAGQNLVAGPMKDASLTSRVFLDRDASEVSINLSDSGQQILTLEGEIPFNPVSLVSRADDLRAEISRILNTEPSRLKLVLARSQLAQFPFTSGLPPEIARTEVAADLQASGTLRNPVIDGQLDVTTFLMGQTMDLLALFSTVEDTLIVELTTSRDERALVEARMEIPGLRELVSGTDLKELLRSPRLQTKVDILLNTDDLRMFLGDTIDLAALFEPELSANLAVEGNPDGPTGKLNAQLVPSAPPPPEFEGFVGDINLGLRVEHSQSILGVELDPGGNSPRLQLTGKTTVGSKELIDGDVTFKQIPFQAALNSKGMPLSALSRIMPSLFGAATSGKLVSNLAVTGTPENIDANGYLELNFETLDLVPAGLRQSDAVFRLEVSNDKVILVPTTLERKKGEMSLEAELGITKLLPSKMPLTASVVFDDYQVLGRRDLKAEISGSIDVKGTLGAPDIEGKLKVEDALFRVDTGGRTLHDTDRPSDVVFANEITTESKESSMQRFGSDTGSRFKDPSELMQADIVVKIPERNLRVRHEMLDVFPWGDVTVVLKGSELSVEGVINVEGQVMLYGRTLEITEGSLVTFAGGSQLNPRLNLTARYDISDVDLTSLGLTADSESAVYVDVKGTAEDIQIELRSSPPMDETNIASILALGRPAAAEAEGTVRSQTASLFVGLVTGRLSSVLESELPVDVFQISAGDDLETASVTVGKRLSRDLTLLYRSNIGGDEAESADEVIMRYDIKPYLLLEGVFGLGGQGGLDLLFNWTWD